MWTTSPQTHSWMEITVQTTEHCTDYGTEYNCSVDEGRGGRGASLVAADETVSVSAGSGATPSLQAPAFPRLRLVNFERHSLVTSEDMCVSR